MNPKLKRKPQADTVQDTMFVVPVIDIDGNGFELLLYGLDEQDIYITPNPYVSLALNRRKIPPRYSTSPFFVRRER